MCKNIEGHLANSFPVLSHRQQRRKDVCRSIVENKLRPSFKSLACCCKYDNSLNLSMQSTF
jgi:hypothetical protein